MLLNGIYLLVLLVLSPWLLWRRFRTGRYRAGLTAKLFGRVQFQNPHRKPVAWFHGVSVGEIHLLTTVVTAFRKRHPEWLVVVSSTTDTGLAEARSRFADLTVVPWPFDFTWGLRQAFQTIQPKLLILAEGELWPNAVRIAKESGAKVCVINARMSPRSFRRSLRIAKLMNTWVYQYVDCFAVQSTEYGERFHDLGVPNEKIKVTGSVKYDGVVGNKNTTKTQHLRALFNTPTANRSSLIWVAGSTHSPEERIVLDSFRELKSCFANLQLILVPRHPDRFDEVAELIEKMGLSFVRRSQIHEPLSISPAVILLDSIGELGAAWSLANFGYVGGTLDGKRGGQSMIEPAGYGVPTVFGPHVWNFKGAAAKLVEIGGAFKIESESELSAVIVRYLEDGNLRLQMGETSRKFVLEQQGATERTIDILDQWIEPIRAVKHAA